MVVTKNKRKISYGEAVREAIDQSMGDDPSVFIIGEGVPDPKNIFGTTKGLLDKYGKNRVLDMPLSENALTGVCIGAALQGMRPIMVHQRIDFMLLALDQIINHAAKLHYMFGGKISVPIVIRAIIGRGWGQGAQHSQNLQAIFAHIPGLKVVMPSTPYDAKGLLLASIQDNNPVIFIEHRWLHDIVGHVPEDIYTVPLGKANVVRKGTDLSIVSTSYMTIEALKAVNSIKNASIEIIDVRTIKPLDFETIKKSVEKTGKLLVVDSGHYSGGISGDIIAKVAESLFDKLKAPPQRITLPDIPTPSTHALTKYYYPNHLDIIKKIGNMIGIPQQKIEIILKSEKQKMPENWDVPEPSFTGPF